jgi:O-antigen ligase
MVSVALTGGLIVQQLSGTLTYVLLFVLVAHSLQTFRAFRLTAVSILAISLFLGGVAFIQAQSPFSCILLTAEVDPDVNGVPDGRLCETSAECRVDADPGDNYRCERPGPLGTISFSGRVRYRGNLEDPNELALVLVAALPFAMALLAERRSLIRILIVIAALAIIFPVVIWTASRTGQLALVVVITVYLLRQAKLKHMLAVAAATAPVMLPGGRSVEGPDASALERLEAWHAGIDFLRSSPIWGIGKSQFVENHYITAHNTFVLEAAELGFVGLILWVGVFYTSFKIVVVAVRRYRGRADGAVPYAWARALLASLCAIAIGSSFLSLAYHPIIWTFLALPGAFYLSARRHDPEYRVVFGARDLLGVAGFSILWLAGLRVYLALRGL